MIPTIFLTQYKWVFTHEKYIAVFILYGYAVCYIVCYAVHVCETGSRECDHF